MKGKKTTTAVICVLMMVTAMLVFAPNIGAEPDSKTYKIAWLMIIDWDSDYPSAPYYLSIHPDKPSDWTITYTSIWFDDIQGGECLVANYDLIVTTGHQYYTFTNEQRAILEEYVRSGGVLWFDDCGDIEIDNLPFGYEINFANEFYPPWGYAYNSPTNHDYTISQPTHPLMDGEFHISSDHIRDDRATTRWFNPFIDWDPHYEVVLSGVDQNRGLSGPAVLAVQVGYGKIIATAMDVTCAMEANAYGGWPATRFDFHLVFNMLNWATQPTFKNYEITWVTPSEGGEYFIDEVVPLEFTVVDENGTPVNDNTSFIEVWKGSTFISDAFTITISNGVYTSSWDTTGMTEGNYTILADFEGYCSQEAVNMTLKLNQPPVADAGPDQTVNEGDTVHFNGTGSYDPDPKVDMVFVVDTSPSMPDEWTVLSTTLPTIETTLEAEGYDLDFTVLGLDHGNTYDSTVMDGWMDYGIRIQPNGSRLTDCLRNTLISNPHGHNVNTANPSPCLLNPNQTCDSHSTHVSEGWAQGGAYIAVHHSWRSGAIRIVSPIGDSAPWHQTNDGVSDSGPPGHPHVYPEDWDTINGTAIIANENNVRMFPMYDEALDPDGPDNPGTGPIQDLFISLGEQTNGKAYPIDDEESFINDVIQLIQDSVLTYSWDFDANVDSDGDGISTNDMDGTGPTPTHIYGDDGDGTDGNYTVTLTVTDNGNLTDTDTCIVTVLNVDPDATIESAVMDVEISIRVAGSKWSNVGLTLYEDNSSVGYLEVERWPGSPDDNPTYENPALPTMLDMTKRYKAIVTYDPYPDNGDEIKGDQPNNGKDKKDNAGNPVWIILRFEDGNETRIHHTFNTQQSMIRNSNHWNHIEPWEVELNSYLVGHPFTVTAEITDLGSDDEQLTHSYGTQTIIKTYFNNAPTNTPDPYPSPEVNPRYIIDITTMVYEGAGTLTLDVKDDDNIRLSTSGSSQSISIA